MFPASVRLVFALLILDVAMPALPQAKRVSPVNAAAKTAFSSGDKVAVVVGVGGYPELSGLSRLDYPAADATSLAGVLEAQGYTVNTLTDANAMRGTISRALEAAAAVVDRADGMLVFYFSGHGFSENGVNYLATYDTITTELGTTALSFDKIKQLLERSPAKRKVVFLDACRNDPGRGAKSAGLRTFTEFKQAEGMKILFSTKSGSFSYEDKALEHGIFTHFLIEGLKGEAAGEDGFVTFDDLKGFVQSGVKLYAIKKSWSQIPFDAGEATGDFLLARAPKARGINPALVRLAEEQEAFEFTKTKLDSVAGWKKFLDLYPAGTHAAEAKRRVEELEGSDQTTILSNDLASTLYALGTSLGGRLLDFNLTLAELEFVAKGMADAEAGKASFDSATWEPKIQELLKQRKNPEGAARRDAVGEVDLGKTIYAIGTAFGGGLVSFSLNASELKLVKRGVVDAASGTAKYDPGAWDTKIAELQRQRSIAAGSAYAADAARQPGAVRTSSGMIYIEQRIGSGTSPHATDEIKVNYRGTLTNGREFDSTYKRNEPVVIPLTSVIPCWVEGMQRVRVGGKAKLVCPPELAFGEKGLGPIPPHATLIFEVELLAVNPK